ncbi:MAG: nucleotidyltransferase family protein [Acholeplasmatales bacterium]|nr:nucleotidyltransferase family protein [Acholeplasmatales bacterium]
MKIVGIIVEYNPLHNGHVHHINEIKKQANADVIIAIMSSSFTMRGDLSLFDKFTKAKQALNNGVDLVLELPLVYSIQRADLFAYHSTAFLSLLKVDEIWIGSEQNNELIYEEYYKKYLDNINNINDCMKNGYSYKEATASFLDLESNDILGFSYYKAIKENNYNIKLKTIKRLNSNYLDKNPSNEKIASALSIRNDINRIYDYCPAYVYNDFNKIIDENKLFDLLKYKILSSNINELNQLFFVDEGLENKLIEIINYNNLNDFISALASKRYTKTRIKRMLVYILLNIKKKEINEILNNKIDFIRVLGFNEIGRKYISTFKKELTIYTNIKEGLNKALDIEFNASRLLDSVYDLKLIKNEQGGPIK